MVWVLLSSLPTLFGLLLIGRSSSLNDVSACHDSPLFDLYTDFRRRIVELGAPSSIFSSRAACF
jgi:hypothetical protein